MSDLISKSALLEKIKNQMPQFGGGIISQTIAVCTDVAVELVKEAPAVDAVPVVHGRWIRTANDPLVNKFTCSVCGNDSMKGKCCPNCGAKMDGENDNV